MNPVMGIKYKELIDRLVEVCKDKSIDDSSFLSLHEKTENNHKVGYILSPLEEEVSLENILYLNLVKGLQVRLDDLTKVLKLNALIPEIRIKRLVGHESKEVYICEYEDLRKKLLEVSPREVLEKAEMATDYGYGEDKSIPGKREIRFYNAYRVYKPLLEVLKKVGYGIYEVVYKKEMDLQEILDGEIPIGFERIKRVFP